MAPATNFMSCYLFFKVAIFDDSNNNHKKSPAELQPGFYGIYNI